ncbi:YncE family protein [Mariniflexile sp. AS56]|uniref:YncE family protein n=1 Tax=Mariniflexile sp. AS56 TaxID=3063957 RepID=UPI0026F07748|nr:cell surface protein [Mariniflexile sp. AS56]MDO7170625.1 cell surface protein [Mariniflexile sp. AS56]
MKKIILSIFTLSLFVLSCSNDDDAVVLPLGDYENGILVSCEGGPSSISFISNDFMTTENQIYFNVNNEELGVYLQSVGFNDSDAYIVTDNANTINVVNRYTFEKKTTITTGLSTPRYIAFLNGKGYVTNWGEGGVASDDFIAVVDLATNTVESTIAVGEGPEQILAVGNKLFVSHKGGYGSNNIVTVINTATNDVATITVNDNPDEMVINNAGDLVVLCSGAVQYDASWNVIGNTDGSIVKINVSDNSIISNFNFANGVHPGLMAYNNGALYYVSANKVYTMGDASTSLPTSSIIDLTASYAYGLSVNNNKLYVADASFSAQSELVVYDLSSKTITNTFPVGLGASKIYFNN